MKIFLALGLILTLAACDTTKDSSSDQTEQKETVSTEENAESANDSSESTSSEEDTEEEPEESTEETDTEEDIANTDTESSDSVSPDESSEPEITEISLETVLSEEEGTMHDASKQELEDELITFIEKTGDENITDKMVYDKLLEMLGGHPDVQKGIKYFMNFSPELVDLTDQPGGMKIEDGVVSLKNNVYILMDNSGSMSEEIDGKTKMDAARDSVNQFVEDMPTGTQVSLISYGFNNENDSHENSCSAVEETFPIGEYDEDGFNEALKKYGSEGDTPLASAIEHVGEIIAQSDSTGSHTVYVVSDGQETCNGDPVEAVKDMPEDENVETVLNIIGFDINDDEVQALVDVTEANGGEYLEATNPDELTRVLNMEKLALIRQYREWSNENLQNITQSSNDKLADRTQISNNASTENRQLTNKMNGVLNDVSNASSQEYQFNDAKDLVEERNQIISEFLKENHESSGDDTNAEKDELQGIVNQQFDEIEKKYEEDVE